MLALAALAALSVVLVRPDAAWAHEVFIGQSKILQDGDVVRYELAVDYGELAQRVDLGEAGTDEGRVAALEAARPRLESYLGEHVRVLRDGTGCVGALEAVEVIRHLGQVFAALTSAYQCPASGTGAYVVEYGVFFDARSASHRTTHASLADYEIGGTAGRAVLEPGNPRIEVGGAGVAGGAASAGGGAASGGASGATEAGAASVAPATTAGAAAVVVPALVVVLAGPLLLLTRLRRRPQLGPEG